MSEKELICVLNNLREAIDDLRYVVNSATDGYGSSLHDVRCHLVAARDGINALRAREADNE